MVIDEWLAPDGNHHRLTERVTQTLSVVTNGSYCLGCASHLAFNRQL